LEVLRRGVGDSFDAGLINGPLGKGTITALTESSLALSFRWKAESSAAPTSPGVTLIIGLPRPQTAKAILRDLTSLGVNSMHFVVTEKGDPNYRLSSLWTNAEWRTHIIAGAEQAFTTSLPKVTFGETLTTTLALPELQSSTRLALDNYEAPLPLSQFTSAHQQLVLAIGPERGWSNVEREMLRQHGFNLVHLGPRVLRTETACVCAVTIALARLGRL
jgi:16S rRNA (uracil1498-N3)-methyltransferase